MRDEEATFTAVRWTDTDADGYSREPRFTLDAVAVRCRVHPSTVLRYERLGLIATTARGNAVGRYSESDIARVLRIRRLVNDLGVNLAGVEAILHLRDQVLTLRRTLHGPGGDGA